MWLLSLVVGGLLLLWWLVAGMRQYEAQLQGQELPPSSSVPWWVLGGLGLLAWVSWNVYQDQVSPPPDVEQLVSAEEGHLQ